MRIRRIAVAGLIAATALASPVAAFAKGGDDPAGHNKGDDRGKRVVQVVERRHGQDDPKGHDKGDDRGKNRRHGQDDPKGHDKGDERGGHR